MRKVLAFFTKTVAPTEHPPMAVNNMVTPDPSNSIPAAGINTVLLDPSDGEGEGGDDWFEGVMGSVINAPHSIAC